MKKKVDLHIIMIHDIHHIIIFIQKLTKKSDLFPETILNQILIHPQVTIKAEIYFKIQYKTFFNLFSKRRNL